MIIIPLLQLLIITTLILSSMIIKLYNQQFIIITIIMIIMIMLNYHLILSDARYNHHYHHRHRQSPRDYSMKYELRFWPDYQNYFLSLEFHIHNDEDDAYDNHFENRQTDRKSGQVQSKYRDVNMDLDDGG
ncbi:hypothetical protein DERP_014402 [Dermatophagoides pteronyssinus]|uniref:Uncharacterized protein n=1 Tax=Dermatophagoides pteronyssinus TaxID=6956 RepID=A0ABQ8J5Y8_DERPT|nr:hypothetical protein DERP_014402 [Dermatophagoides pteronyssinus]